MFYEPTRKSEVYISAVHVGEREDLSFAMGEVERVDLEPYTRVDAGAKYEVMRGLKLTARGENLLDEHYQEAYEYGMMPLSVYAGVDYTFQAESAY